MQIPDGYMPDAKGRLWPVDQVPPVDALMTQTVEKIVSFADQLAAQIGRFKGHCYDDIATMIDLMAERYGARPGGPKGNITLTSFDGTKKVVIQVADKMFFGPELQVAKTLVDECIAAWAEGAGGELRALVDHAFQVDQAGKVNRAALLSLRRVQIADPTWRRAMEALTDSIRVIGSREYLRVYRRPSARAAWEQIPLDLASCVAPPPAVAAAPAGAS